MAARQRPLVFAYLLVLAGLTCGAIAVAAVTDGNLSRSVIAGVPALAFVAGGLLLDTRRPGGAKE
jgi:hypothetical protein